MSTILRVRRLCAESSAWAVEGWYINALDQVSLDVDEREIVVLLGAPGAGKTLLLQVILDLLRPSSGDVRLFGFPSSDWTWKPEVGYLPQSFRLQAAWSAQEFLRYVAEVREIMWGNRMNECVDTLLDEVGLSEAKHRPVRAYNREMMMRLGVAQALLHNPRLLILDEPSEGIGWWGLEMLRGLLGRFRSRGGGVLLSARRLTEVELSADRIVLIHEGRVATEVDINVLRSSTSGQEKHPPSRTVESPPQRAADPATGQTEHPRRRISIPNQLSERETSISHD